MTTVSNSVHVLCLGFTQQCVSGISGPVPLHWQLHRGYKTLKKSCRREKNAMHPL